VAVHPNPVNPVNPVYKNVRTQHGSAMNRFANWATGAVAVQCAPDPHIPARGDSGQGRPRNGLITNYQLLIANNHLRSPRPSPVRSGGEFGVRERHGCGCARLLLVRRGGF
jgi:hypothetical protein